MEFSKILIKCSGFSARSFHSGQIRSQPSVELWNLCLVHRLRVFFIHQASKSLSLQLCNLDKYLKSVSGQISRAPSPCSSLLTLNTLPHKFSHLSILYLWISISFLLICFALFGLHFPAFFWKMPQAKNFSECGIPPLVFPFSQG